MYDKEFRLSHDPDTSSAEELVIGKCVKEYKKYSNSENRTKEIKKLSDSHYANTQVVDYINAGQNGYYRVEAKVVKNRKRGKRYFVAVESKSFYCSYNKINGASFSSKKEAEDYAKKYAAQNLKNDVYVINEKDEKLASVYLSLKHYKTKPNLIKKDGRNVCPAYQYVLIGTAYVG